MSKFIGLRLSDDDYNLLSRLAKSSGKSISTFIRELSLSAVKSEVQENRIFHNLLTNLERAINNLNVQKNSAGQTGMDRDFLKDILFITLSTYNLMLQYANSTLLVADKKKAFLSEVEGFEIKNFGKTVAEKFFE